MIKDIEAKMNFSDKDKMILSINHNYYVRTAIATLADMFLTFIIVCIIAAVVTILGLMFLIGLESSDEAHQIGTAIMVAAITIDVLLGVFYFIYVIVKIARVSKMRKHVNRIENDVIRKCVVAEKPAPEAKTEAE